MRLFVCLPGHPPALPVHSICAPSVICHLLLLVMAVQVSALTLLEEQAAGKQYSPFSKFTDMLHFRIRVLSLVFSINGDAMLATEKLSTSYHFCLRTPVADSLIKESKPGACVNRSFGDPFRLCNQLPVQPEITHSLEYLLYAFLPISCAYKIEIREFGKGLAQSDFNQNYFPGSPSEAPAIGEGTPSVASMSTMSSVL